MPIDEDDDEDAGPVEEVEALLLLYMRLVELGVEAGVGCGETFVPGVVMRRCCCCCCCCWGWFDWYCCGCCCWMIIC